MSLETNIHGPIFPPGHEVFLSLRGTVKKGMVVSEETHATNRTPYYCIKLEGGGAVEFHPDFIHQTQEGAQEEADGYKRATDRSLPLNFQIAAHRMEQNKHQAMSKQVTAEMTALVLKKDREALEKLVTDALPDMPREEALRTFCIAHEFQRALKPAHEFANTFGADIYLLVKEGLKTPLSPKAPKKTETPGPKMA